MLSFADRACGRTAVLGGQSAESDDVNEEIDPPEIRRTRGPQVGSSLQTVNLCIDGLVLLNQSIEGLSVAVLIQP